MNKHYDVIVAGAGSMGMAAGYFLAKRGVKVLLVDAFDPPHDQGSHFGETRIIRHAYGEDRRYVPLVLRAQDLWNELEKQTHMKIFTQVGSLGFCEQGNSPFIDEAIASGKEYDLDVQLLTANEMKTRFPGLTVPENYMAFYEADSGFLFSENAIQAYKELSVHYGAELSMNNPVRNIKISNDSVTVITDQGEFTGEQLILSAGAWSGKLSEKLELQLPLKPTRQPVAWFEANEELFNAKAFPTFMAEIPTTDSYALYYGFPSFGNCGLKIGRHDYIDPINPDTMNREFGSNANDEGHLREFLDTFLPEASGKLIKGTICMYTRTPDGHFIIDKHPKYPNVTIATGFSGHGFKFASVVGEILSHLAVDGETNHDISLFKLERFK